MSRLFIYESNVILTIVLCRLSLLLCAGWLLHAALRGRNPWLSIWSWRVIIAGVVVVVITGPYLQAWGPEFGPGYRNLSRPQERSTKFDKVDLGNSNREPNEHDETRADVNMVDVATFPSAEIANGNRSLAKFVRWIRLSIDGKTLWKGYCAVVGILLSQLFFQFIGIQKILRRAEPGDDDIESLVRTTAQSLGLGKPPGVLLSTLVSGPLATGILRPTIVLPVGMADQFSDRDLRFVIAHECSHFAGGDLGWALAARVLRILLWPHPLAWGIPTAHRLACDIRCDAVAAGRDTAGYIKMLAGLAISWHARSVPALTMAFLGQSETIRRVELLDAGIGRDRPSLFRQLHTVLGLGIVVGLIGTMGTNHSRTG